MWGGGGGVIVVCESSEGGGKGYLDKNSFEVGYSFLQGAIVQLPLFGYHCIRPIKADAVGGIVDVELPVLIVETHPSQQQGIACCTGVRPLQVTLFFVSYTYSQTHAHTQSMPSHTFSLSLSLSPLASGGHP